MGLISIPIPCFIYLSLSLFKPTFVIPFKLPTFNTQSSSKLISTIDTSAISDMDCLDNNFLSIKATIKPIMVLIIIDRLSLNLTSLFNAQKEATVIKDVTIHI